MILPRTRKGQIYTKRACNENSSSTFGSHQTLVIWHAAKPQPLAVAGMTHSTLYSRAGQNETLFREMAHNTPCSRVEYTGGPS
eukprot:scaffold66632_cov20-Tisochrysis_lutea.AAC.1